MPPQNFDDAVSMVEDALRCHPAGLFIDIDGTICPIVVNPADARVPSSVKRALRTLRQNVETVAIISGRSLSDARKTVGVGAIDYIGNHGMEYLHRGRRSVDLAVQAHLPQLRACLRTVQASLDDSSLTVEDKHVTASIHYRGATDSRAARSMILRAIEQCPPCQTLRVTEGKMVVNILPGVAVNKGTALTRIAERQRLRGIVYIGDDVTDLDAFRALQERRVIGAVTVAIAVASSEGPPELVAEADVTLSSVEQTGELLTRLSSTKL